MTLSLRLFATLENLAEKKAGRDVGWINIADARALTDLGLAERSREGWNITPEGVSALAARSASDGGQTPPDPYR